MQIEHGRRLTREQFGQLSAEIDARKEAVLVPAQLPIKHLSRTISDNIITPASMPIPDCLTCGVCCDFAVCVPVSTGDETSAEKFWEITEDESSAEIVVERFLRLDVKAGVCASLVGKIKERVACAIYETRPRTCREFEAGSDRCHAFRRMYKLEQPLTEKQIAKAKAKLQKARRTEKISFVQIVAEEVKSVGVRMSRLPDNTISVSKEETVTVVCKVYIGVEGETPHEIYSYNPTEETWYEHEFYGLTLAQAHNLIVMNERFDRPLKSQPVAAL